MVFAYMIHRVVCWCVLWMWCPCLCVSLSLSLSYALAVLLPSLPLDLSPLPPLLSPPPSPSLPISLKQQRPRSVGASVRRASLWTSANNIANIGGRTSCQSCSEALLSKYALIVLCTVSIVAASEFHTTALLLCIAEVLVLLTQSVAHCVRVLVSFIMRCLCGALCLFLVTCLFYCWSLCCVLVSCACLPLSLFSPDFVWVLNAGDFQSTVLSAVEQHDGQLQHTVRAFVDAPQAVTSMLAGAAQRNELAGEPTLPPLPSLASLPSTTSQLLLVGHCGCGWHLPPSC